MIDNDSLIGKQIDNYKVESWLGKGGMATVYLAEDVALKRAVVIKMMLPELAREEGLRLRFQREAQATARLHHPNIVPIYTTGTTDNELPYLALRYIEGGALSERLKKLSQEGQWVSTIYALSVARQIGAALVVAHQANIVHRDLKPSNILLRSDGTPVISDLGIAALQYETKHLTRTGGVIGTPNYMSPEQAGSQLIDGRSDIYSLGVILYELLSGSLPFQANSPVAMLHHHIYEPPTPLQQVRPDLTAITYHIVATCLQKQPADRYVDAQAFVAALDQAIAAENANPKMTAHTQVYAWEPSSIGSTEITPPLSPTSIVLSHVEKKRQLLPYLLSIGFLLLVVFGIFMWQGGTNNSEPTANAKSFIAEIVPTEIVSTNTPSPTVPPTPTIEPTATATLYPTQTATPLPTAEPQPTSMPIKLQPSNITASSVAPPSNDACGNITTYEPINAIDSLPETAWRVLGDGINEFIQINFSPRVEVDAVKLIPGYTKIDPCDGIDRFPQTRRIRRVRLNFSDGSTVEGLLFDNRELQEISTLPPITTTFIRITILESSELTTFDITALSEIEFWGRIAP